MALRQGRFLTDQEKSFFLDLKPDDITKSFLQNLFADNYDTTTGKIVQSKYNTFDQFVLKPGEYFNKEQITTNCGLFIFNKRVLEKHYLSRIGYQNKEMTNKQYKKLNTTLAEFASKDIEEFNKYVEFLNVVRWLGDTIHVEICSSMSLKSSKPIPAVQKKKAELLKKYDKEIKEGRLDVINDITNQLLDESKKELSDDPSLELYDSGARGAFDNAYRRMQVMVGPVFNASTGQYDIVTNSLYDGYTKDQIATIANNAVSAFYPKAIGSGEAGYLSKQIIAAFQTVVLDDEGSDCKTKGTRKITLTSDMISLYMYCFMMEGAKIVQLTPENQGKYAGKTVNMRVASLCTSTKPCSICSGTRFYDMGLKNVGLTISKVSGTFLNGKMKGSHDMTVRTATLSVEDMIE